MGFIGDTTRVTQHVHLVNTPKNLYCMKKVGCMQHVYRFNATCNYLVTFDDYTYCMQQICGMIDGCHTILRSV